ncbi:multiple sugar transport system substrate-binding protein [Streptosporangium becharense]|uniref:Multiple sugar transport system substrate-binding protein n=1 Tax=Streptosporangium becharense TaxID=1816182 RepID=A0A7W9IMF7_9ACTN|nr:extracellular solute-binding protein [Streptosporangium becharense]MBB2910297.1 multiple sugar transport system substrate-binding protein [Streptosporangium becharense]MBB5823040.1 multiple sugar transport system substrate-binding protein [Streptosporangium becharense]
MPHPSISRRRLLGLAAGLGAAAALPGCAVPRVDRTGSGGPVTLNALFMKQASYSEDDVRAMLKAFTQAHPDITVQPTFVAFEALHDKIVVSAPAGTYDVVLIDCTWPAELASKNMLLDVTARYEPAWLDDILAGTLGGISYQDRKYGIPWNPGGKMFFYNTRMLKEAGIAEEAMTTWDGVLQAARTLKAKKIVEHPMVWSWAHAEALICDYAQLLGAFDGRFLDESGKAAFHVGGGVKALEWMKLTLDEKLSAPSSVKLLEDDVKRVVCQGDAAIALNWDYMYAESNDPKQSKIVGELKPALSPKGPGGKGPAVNGSMGLSVTATSKNPDAAWELVAFLAGKENQLRYAERSLPVWKSAYQDPKLTTGPMAPLVAAEQAQLESLIERPAVVQYNAVSQQIQAAVQSCLVAGTPAQQALAEAAAKVDKIIGERS